VIKWRGLDGRRVVLRIVVLCTALMPALAWADAHHPVFDLPAQPLDRAIEQFSIGTGWSVMYPGSLADGRYSHAVDGTMPPMQALQALLQGTGLEAVEAGEGRIVLRARVEGGPLPTAAPTAGDEALQRIQFGHVQRALRDVFCGDPLLQPGDYSARIALHLSSTGAVQHAELVEDSGDAHRDRALLAALHALDLPSSVAVLPQPVTLDIRRTPPGRDCGRRRPSP